MPRSEADNEAIRSERRFSILSAAARVFARQGYVGTRIEDLASAAGVSKGLLYHYFASKEEVFNTLMEQASRGSLGLLERAAARQGNVADRLRWLVEQEMGGLTEDAHIFMVALQAMISDAVPLRARQIAGDLVARSEGLLSELVGQGQVEGSLSDAPELALVFGTLMHGIAVSAAIAGGVAARSPERLMPRAESIIGLLVPNRR